VVSYVAPVEPIGNSPTFTRVEGTITNTGPTAANYTIQVWSSSGSTSSATALDVLAGQTATWTTLLVGLVTVAGVEVTSTPAVAAPVPAVAMITSQRRVMYLDDGWRTEVRGTVTNTGTTMTYFWIELQATNGEVATAEPGVSYGVSGVLPGDTVEWATLVSDNTTARIIRVTPPHPQGFA